jgi:hypothetical protein
MLAHREDHTMTRLRILSLATAGLIGLCATGIAAAQEKQKVSFKVLAENTKFAKQYTLDVGDAPGHRLVLFELHRTHPSNAPVINGVKLVEQIAYALSDNTNGDGTNIGYYIFLMENGDKVFTRYSLVSQRDQPSTLVGPITGGTGKFAGIRGVIRQVSTTAVAQWDIEYWMEK